MRAVMAVPEVLDWSPGLVTVTALVTVQVKLADREAGAVGGRDGDREAPAVVGVPGDVAGGGVDGQPGGSPVAE